MKGFLSFSTFLLVSSFLTFSAHTEPQPDTVKPSPDSLNMVGIAETWSDTTVSGFHLSWMTDTLGMLHVRLSASTTGWVAIGFDPKNMKKDANLIIGYVRKDTVYIQDNFGVTPVMHASDVSLGGSDDVTLKQGTESDGVTEIGFAIPLDSGDEFDQKLVRGQSVKVILAYAPNGMDDFNSIHKATASIEIEIK